MKTIKSKIDRFLRLMAVGMNTAHYNQFCGF